MEHVPPWRTVRAWLIFSAGVGAAAVAYEVHDASTPVGFDLARRLARLPEVQSLRLGDGDGDGDGGGDEQQFLAGLMARASLLVAAGRAVCTLLWPRFSAHLHRAFVSVVALAYTAQLGPLGFLQAWAYRLGLGSLLALARTAEPPTAEEVREALADLPGLDPLPGAPDDLFDPSHDIALDPHGARTDAGAASPARSAPSFFGGPGSPQSGTASPRPGVGASPRGGGHAFDAAVGMVPREVYDAWRAAEPGLLAGRHEVRTRLKLPGSRPPVRSHAEARPPAGSTAAASTSSRDLGGGDDGGNSGGSGEGGGGGNGSLPALRSPRFEEPSDRSSPW